MPESIPAYPQAPQSAAWIEGLDAMRGFGALIVVLAHILMQTPQEMPYSHPGVTWRVVYVGNLLLEVFFAMSGFLIGRELLKNVDTKPTWALLGGYWLKRWTRTLPAYYGLLLIAMIWGVYQTGAWRLRWEHIFFVQAYTTEKNFWGVTWSLSVEQWGYALLPLLIFGIQRLFPHKYSAVQRVMLAAGCIVVGSCILRGLTITANPHVLMDDVIRKAPHLRLDALMFGLLLACCKKSYPQIYSKLQSGWLVLLVTAFSFAFIELQYQDNFIRGIGETKRFFHATAGFTLLGTMAALLLPYLERDVVPTLLARHVPKTHALLKSASLTSYSLYLIHLPLIHFFAGNFHKIRASSPWLNSISFAVGMWGIVVLSLWLSRLNFALMEKPGMASRKWLEGFIHKF